MGSAEIEEDSLALPAPVFHSSPPLNESGTRTTSLNVCTSMIIVIVRLNRQKKVNEM